MNLLQTSGLTAIATMIKVASGFVINKTIAIYIGPSGLALIGQMHNVVGILTSFSNGGIRTGITKYTSEYQSMAEKKKIFSSSTLISLISSLLISFFLLSFSETLSLKILNDAKYSHVFIVFAATILFFAFNINLMSILNGQKEIKKYVFINIINSIFSLFLTSILIIKLNLIGALYALVINQSVIFFITLGFVIKSKWFKFQYFLGGIDSKSFKELSKYSFMAFVSAVVAPLSHIIIRNNIGINLGWESAGYWQGIWYISSMYLLVVTSSLGVYYLPTLSSISSKKDLRIEIINGFKIILPIIITLAFCIFFLREFIISIAFTEDFIAMKKLFKWQLIGDVIKISGWLLGYIMVAKAMTKTFIITEIVFSISFVLLSSFFINNYGLIGVTYAFSLNYLIYFITMLFITRKYLYDSK